MANTDSQQNEQVLVRHVTAENAHRLEETLATLDPECVFEDLALRRRFHGRDGAAEYYRIWWDAFQVEVEGVARHWTTEGRFIGEAMYVGRHTGDFFGLPPTGRPIELRFTVFVDFRNGLMSGERFYYDLSTLLGQLGATRLPALG